MTSPLFQSYSFGGKLLFIGPTMAFIGYILILISFVRPVGPDLNKETLSENRLYNLLVFVGSFSFVTFTYIFLWIWAKSYLIS